MKSEMLVFGESGKLDLHYVLYVVAGCLLEYFWI